jgi:hypothetical protein
MPDRRRFGRTPDTICLLAVLAAVGAVLTVSGEVPKSVAELVPLPLGLMWSATFTLAAGVSLAGVLWRDHLTGWAIELAGRIGLACTCLAYTVALVGAATVWGSAIVIGVITSIGGSSVWRVWQLARRVDQFKATVLAYEQIRASTTRGGGGV